MSRFRQLDDLFRRFCGDGLPGCSCVIAKQGDILYENYTGFADVENGVPLTEKHVFRQASLTKVAMYTAAMMLYEQGRFLMSDPLYEYFPEWRDSKKLVPRPDGGYDVVPVEHPITIKNIMNMTCGLPYHMLGNDEMQAHPCSSMMREAMEPLTAKGYYTLREQIRAVSQVPLAFEPGTAWLYGFASELTAGLIEAVYGKCAELAIKELLFEPLGMDSSANFTFGDLPQRLVKNYRLRPGKALGDPDALTVCPPDREAMMAGPLGTVPGFSRVITNCADFTKLMQMLSNGGVYRGVRVMGRKTIDLMRCNTVPLAILDRDFSNDYLAGYGYGYGVRTLMDRYKAHFGGSPGQFGWTGGSGTWAECDPSQGISVVYMHNLQPNLELYHHIRMRSVAFGCLSRDD